MKTVFSIKVVILAIAAAGLAADTALAPDDLCRFIGGVVIGWVVAWSFSLLGKEEEGI